MDREPEELQFLGLFGIYKESINIIFSWRKIFNKITLVLILPLTFIFLAHIQISDLIFSKIIQNQEALDFTRSGTASYNSLTDRISKEWIAFWLFKAIYLFFLLIFSLLSTSAVVYTIASIYTAKDLTFKKVMTVVPKVWKRLMVTFLWSFIIVFLYNFIAAIFFVLVIISVGGTAAGTFILIALLLIYFSGVVYISVLWHLASVISVLEDFKGIKAMMKSKALIKGKMWIACAIFVKLIIALILIQYGFERLVVVGDRFGGIGIRVFYAFVCFLLLMQLFMFGLVVQTVFYFVCKSYHHENIDRSMLADHLEVYAGEYIPLNGKNIQLEQYDI
ncbi:hypothetical protein NE237_019398 [Protea cynaroides]|uniref:Uncharacterized protein n=1 Tax=Protea cynaroides TaxID=273540 RepID=A0A9Q0KBT1_9MAGN|nr:hypothetical protein NE237_019398 [Protea cynaroides]